MRLIDSRTLFGAFLFSISLVSCQSDRTTPATDAVTVSQDGSGTYSTVQEGINALSTTATGEQTLFIYPGVYYEQVYIAPRAANLTIQGYTTDASSYSSNIVNITYNLSQNNVSTNDLTATVRAWSENTKFYNLNIINSIGKQSTNGQAVAVAAQATGQGYYGCGLYGYQDTLLANKGKQLYAQSLIAGATDFIFGLEGLAWFEQVDLSIKGQGFITASGRSTDDDGWYVINNSSVRGADATLDAETGLTYLGRPWRNYARVTFQNTYLSGVVKSVGWSVWSTTDTRTDETSLEEYNNSGPGSEGTRASFSKELTAARGFEEVLGVGVSNEWWVDSSYLS